MTASHLAPVEPAVTTSALALRAVTITLPSASQAGLGVGCARCGHQLTVALTTGGMAEGQEFLRSHTACLS